MKLFLLKPRDPDSFPWDPWYDKTFGLVIRAERETEAREIADFNSGGDENNEKEGLFPWLNVYLTTCEELLPEGESGVILKDFHSA